MDGRGPEHSYPEIVPKVALANFLGVNLKHQVCEHTLLGFSEHLTLPGQQGKVLKKMFFHSYSRAVCSES